MAAEQGEGVYYEIPINDSSLNESGFTVFKLPLSNGNNGKKAKMILWNKEDKVKITYADFYNTDIEKSVKSLEEKLVSEQHVDNVIILYLIAYFRNECLILKEDKDSIFFKNGNGKPAAAVKSNNKKKKKTNDEEREPRKREFTAYKYSNRGKDPLYEAVILEGRPVFLTWVNGEIKRYDALEENRVINPPHAEHYAYEPYEFANMDEVLRYVNRALKENIDSLYLQAKQIAYDYNDQKKDKVNLLAIDIIASYSQDRFPTIHYDIILGGNGSGKSSYGDTFAAIGYRVVNLTNPNAANINRILGVIEIGQCTIISDETGAIDKYPDLMAILKTGYSVRGRTSKINDNTRDPEFFFTYCFKMIISERMPNLRDAKGVVDRSFSFTTYKGKPKYDIKETLDPQGNQARQARLDALNDFRKLMLIYRLIHFKDPISDIDVSVEGREKELCKPIIQLFYNTKAQAEVEKTLQTFLNLRNEKKEITLEPILHTVVTKLVKEKGNEVYVKRIWDELRDSIPDGHYDDKKPNEYQTFEYGTIYNNTISNILEHTFGGRPKHRNNGNTFIFDLEELTRVGKVYNITTTIQTKIVIESDGEGYEGNEGYTEAPTPQNDGKDENPRGNSDTNTSQKEENNKGEPSQEPSQPSQPSPIDSLTNISNNDSIYRLGHSDIWACHDCKQRGDRWFMEKHLCKAVPKKR